jgi:hypothetical protein
MVRVRYFNISDTKNPTTNARTLTVIVERPAIWANEETAPETPKYNPENWALERVESFMFLSREMTAMPLTERCHVICVYVIDTRYKINHKP